MKDKDKTPGAGGDCDRGGSSGAGRRRTGREGGAGKESADPHADLITNARIACIADFVSAVAHEVNTPLGVLTSAADSLRRSADQLDRVCSEMKGADEAARKKLAGVLHVVRENSRVTRDAADRMADIVRRLKRFAHLDEAEYQRVGINDGIDSVLAMIAHSIPEGVAVEKHYEAVPHVYGYPNLLNEMFLSILRNSLRAVGDSGRIRIHTRSEDDGVVIEIEDDGHGIPPEKLDGLFEFAFSHKQGRVGVQTGLSSSYNIVKLHKGSIRVESEVGEGTMVTISLPVDSIQPDKEE